MTGGGVFETHPSVNPPSLTPGCHAFDAQNELHVDPNMYNSFMCTWGSFTEQPGSSSSSVSSPPTPPPATPAEVAGMPPQ